MRAVDHIPSAYRYYVAVPKRGPLTLQYSPSLRASPLSRLVPLADFCTASSPEPVVVHHGKMARRCPRRINRSRSTRPRRAPNVRFTSNSGQTLAPQRNAALCQSRPNAAQQNPCLFDHLVGEREQLVRHVQAERLGSLEIDDHSNFQVSLPAPAFDRKYKEKADPSRL
jgi:hypothetical protein